MVMNYKAGFGKGRGEISQSMRKKAGSRWGWRRQKKSWSFKNISDVQQSFANTLGLGALGSMKNGAQIVRPKCEGEISRKHPPIHILVQVLVEFAGRKGVVLGSRWMEKAASDYEGERDPFWELPWDPAQRLLRIQLKLYLPFCEFLQSRKASYPWAEW